MALAMLPKRTFTMQKPIQACHIACLPREGVVG